MFKAISAKNTLLELASDHNKRVAEKRLRDVERANIVAPLWIARASPFQDDEKLKDDKQLYTELEDDASLAFGVSFGWFEYWIGKIEWALEEFRSAKLWWITAAKGGVVQSDEMPGSAAESVAMAALGQYYHREFKLHGRESDLDTARSCYEYALKKYQKHRSTRYFLLEGEGDGSALLEAALPLLDILLDHAFVEHKKASTSQGPGETDEIKVDEGEEMKGVVDKKAYIEAMNLLQQLSAAQHHWALFRLGLYRMVRLNFISVI